MSWFFFLATTEVLLEKQKILNTSLLADKLSVSKRPLTFFPTVLMPVNKIPELSKKSCVKLNLRKTKYKKEQKRNNKRI